MIQNKREERYNRIHKEFEKNFKNHELKTILVQPEAHLAVFEWMNKNVSNVYAVKYIFYKNQLFVSGDIGEAVFNLTWDASLKNILSPEFNGQNFTYLITKLAAVSGEKYDFDSEIAKDDLVDYAVDDISKSKIKKYLDTADNICNCSSWEAIFYENEYEIDEVFGTDAYDWFFECGKVLNPRIIGMLTGLEMIHKQKGIKKEIKMDSSKQVASTEYAVEVNNDKGFVRQVDVFKSYDAAEEFVETNKTKIQLADGEYFNIIFIDYDKNGNEINFGTVC